MKENRIIEYDFIKGIAIVSVILLHTLDAYLIPSGAFFHMWQAVPLFVLISFILLFKKLEITSLKEYYSWENIKKTLKKILVPFILIELLILLIFIIKGNFSSLPLSYKALGAGPGAYYPFIYLQIWIFAPLFFIMMKNHKWGGWFILLTISILTILSCIFLKEEFLYKRWFIRYAFLGILAWFWHKNRKNSKWIIPLTIISVFYYFLTIYQIFNFEPIFDSRWNTQQLPAYFYTFFLFFVLWSTCRYFTKMSRRFSNFLCWCGKNSYEIFLLQMFWLTFLGELDPIISNYFSKIGYVSLILILSIFPVFLYKEIFIRNKFIKNSISIN